MHLFNLYLLNSGHSNSKHQGRISADTVEKLGYLNGEFLR